MSTIISYTRYLRVSPRKLSLVADAIRKLPPSQAIVALANLNKRASGPLLKGLNSALANAKENHHLSPEELKFSQILVENGPILKRYQPVSRGRAHPIAKRTSHLKIVLKSIKEVATAKKSKTKN